MVKIIFLFSLLEFSKVFMFLFCFTSITLASRANDKCRRQRMEIKGVTTSPVSPSLSISLNMVQRKPYIYYKTLFLINNVVTGTHV